MFEDATPEIVRDFFWDDEFRSNWDDMLLSSTTIEECPTTGTMIVQWTRKVRLTSGFDQSIFILGFPDRLSWWHVLTFGNDLWCSFHSSVKTENT